MLVCINFELTIIVVLKKRTFHRNILSCLSNFKQFYSVCINNLYVIKISNSYIFDLNI